MKKIFIVSALFACTDSLQIAKAQTGDYSRTICKAEHLSDDVGSSVEVTFFEIDGKVNGVFYDEKIEEVGFFPMLFFCSLNCRYSYRPSGDAKEYLTTTLEAFPSLEDPQQIAITTPHGTSVGDGTWTQLLNVSDCKIADE
jgi:hypothetical protein